MTAPHVHRYPPLRSSADFQSGYMPLGLDPYSRYEAHFLSRRSSPRRSSQPPGSTCPRFLSSVLGTTTEYLWTATEDSASSSPLKTHRLIGLPPAPVTKVLLPPSVVRVDLAAANLDLAAYEADTFPTTSAYVETMGVILRHLVEKTPSKNSGVQLRFDAVAVPDVAIDDYLERIRRFFCCSPECFVLAMVYIDRLVRLHEGRVLLSNLNIHRILVTAVTLAAKYFDDVYYSNAYYAKIGGLSPQEMNILESHFLNLIKYNLYVSPREYERYRRDVTFLHEATAAGGDRPPHTTREWHHAESAADDYRDKQQHHHQSFRGHDPMTARVKV